MKNKKKILVSILCLMFIFSITGMAFAAPQDGYYVNGHRYDLALGTSDAGYLTYLDDMAAINFDFTRVIIVANNEFTPVQDAVDAGSITGVLQPNAHEQVGSTIPDTVVPVANDGTTGPSEVVSDTVDTLVLESIAITTPADKLVYNVGEKLDITGMVVTGYFDDDSSKVLPVAIDNVSGFDSSSAVASQTLTVTVGGKTAEYTVEIKEAAGPASAVDVIEAAIAKYTADTSVTSALTFTGNVALLGGRTVHYVTIDPAAISTSKSESSSLAVKIDTIADTEQTTSVNAFPLSEVISGSGMGASLVLNGDLTEDASNYIITLADVDCPQSLLDIIDAAANVGSIEITLSEQKLACTILVSKTTGRVVSIDNISITGTTTAYGAISGANTFTSSAPMVINYTN